MTKKIAIKEMVTIREMLLSNTIKVDALTQLLIEKGIITNEEFYSKLKMFQAEYQKRIKVAG